MPKIERYRAAVIGAGAIAQACHIPGYIRNKHSELVAFVDPALARHKEIEENFPGVRGYTSLDEMLAKEKPNVVSVCTPNKYHAACTIAALNAGCHVLCEKPIAASLQEADLMIAAAKQARKKLMIGFTNRLYRGPQKCKALLQKKTIGKPFMIRVRFAHGGPYPGWAKDKWFYEPDIAAGGVMLDMGIHAIDLALWLFGPIAAVSAKAATLIKRIPVDDNALLLLEFKNGALGYIEVGWTSKPGFTGFELYGTEGSLICDYVHGLKLCSGKASAGADSVNEWEMLDDKPATGGWPIEIDHWMDIVMGKEKLTMDGAAGRAALEVALAAYKSSRAGKRVAIG
ncbi:MAG: Gfo/Idh/MocA family oxidoreductase [Candidatus Hydrogenedentes bacterium]|nr:Gfo/Idh/MocA family oxidoreductase [Candidatus Hydrogenedentota bacterium]